MRRVDYRSIRERSTGRLQVRDWRIEGKGAVGDEAHVATAPFCVELSHLAHTTLDTLNRPRRLYESVC